MIVMMYLFDERHRDSDSSLELQYYTAVLAAMMLIQEQAVPHFDTFAFGVLLLPQVNEEDCAEARLYPVGLCSKCRGPQGGRAGWGGRWKIQPREKVQAWIGNGQGKAEGQKALLPRFILYKI
ncbi:hypothetical protein scyTo_0004136 [Scyliorhinus torazame]|uniref:Uncharacterized protein n=1 Tax=Scyliorhinus torazame TaxID=75743 RepID=A0A401NLE4_SCYTO|nr:hypothetical protein [Scyliorhinus torazame]